MIESCLRSAVAEAGLLLPEDALRAFEVIASELQKWNSRHNLTALCKVEDVAIKHFVDSLFLTEQVSDGENVMDIGSGAGFPALPLKVMRPNSRVVSVDAVSKKVMFQKHVARSLRVSGFEAVHARVEDLQAIFGGQFDVVTSRAFSRLDTFVKLAAPFINDNGRLIAMKGPEVHSEIIQSEPELRSKGFMVTQVIEYELPLKKGKRSLVTLIPCKTP